MKVAVVNVGTIGHVDHGLTTLSTALARLGHEVVFLDEEDLNRCLDEDRKLRLKPQAPVEAMCYGPPLHGRRSDPVRKAERKARLRAARLRAFGGGS